MRVWNAALAIAFGLGLAISSPACLAQTDDSASQTTSAQHPMAIEGTLKGTAIPFDKGVENIGSVGDDLLKETERIAEHAGRENNIMLRGPNVLPGGTVLPPVSTFAPMPIDARKLAGMIDQIEPNFAALQSYVDGLIIPQDKAEAAAPSYTAMRNLVSLAQQHFQQLKLLAANKRLSNKKIAREAAMTHDAIAGVLRQRGELMSAIARASIK